MLPVKSLVCIAVLAVVSISGTLLGLGLESPQVVLIAVGGAGLGFLLADHLKWFQIDGVLANLTSVAILCWAMKDFLPEDSEGKLVSVANLLVYLQTVLMFQKKTPRLIWQILVLSLLQVVVAAIFSLDFEAGLLFFTYFLIAGTTMALQVIHSRNQEMIREYESEANRLVSLHSSRQPAGTRVSSMRPPSLKSKSRTPILIHDFETVHAKSLRPVFLHLSTWLLIATLFTTIMFYLIPRNTRPWYGSARVQTTVTGNSKQVDLTNTGVIEQSIQLFFRASFRSATHDSEPFEPSAPVYFRGMALSSLVLEDGKTTWRAPHDRVQMEVYQKLPPSPDSPGRVTQTITVEPTSDPLIHGVMPVFQSRRSRTDIEFCHEISALTRCRTQEHIDWAPFKYELTTTFDENEAPRKSWPYVSNTRRYQQLPMSADEPQRQWLTHLDPARYPTLVGLADKLVSDARQRNPDLSRIELVRELESWFTQQGQFQYTLDFRTIQWSDNIDPVEDFVRNIRAGHCELFASALTLMLRSQGIPARLVVGFHGGDYNQLTDSLMVRGKHAHAWVEVYLRPEDCSAEMRQQGEAGPGGAWMIADPTPPVAIADVQNTDAIEMARTLWQEYVLGMEGAPLPDSDASSLPSPIMRWLQNAHLDRWTSMIVKTRSKSDLRKWLPQLGIGLFLLVVVYRGLKMMLSPLTNSQSTRVKRPGLLRRIVANAISVVSPNISQWVLTVGRSGDAAALFDRLADLLRPHGFEKRSDQTHRQFATDVIHAYSEHPASSTIERAVRHITEHFHLVRFGQRTLAPDQRTEINEQLSNLKNALTAPDQ